MSQFKNYPDVQNAIFEKSILDCFGQVVSPLCSYWSKVYSWWTNAEIYLLQSIIEWMSWLTALLHMCTHSKVIVYKNECFLWSNVIRKYTLFCQTLLWLDTLRGWPTDLECSDFLHRWHQQDAI